MIGRISSEPRVDGSHVPELPASANFGSCLSRDELSDVAIVQALLSDRPRGATLLFDRFSNQVNRMVWRLMGADRDHDDIVHHIFCSVIGRISTQREAKKLQHWVERVTINTVYAELRKRRVRRVFVASERSQPRFGDLRRDVEARDLLEYANTLLQRMPPRERIAFVLFHVEGHTLNEISELCDWSLSTAKRRLASANQRFDKMFKRESSHTPSAASL